MTIQEKLRAAFVAKAQTAREEMLRTRMGFDACEVHEYLKARIVSPTTVQPTPKSFK